MTVALRRAWARDLDAAGPGFARDGAEFVEDGIPHVPMLKPESL